MINKRKLIVGFLAFDGIHSLDLFGPLEALAEANSSGQSIGIQYELVIISEKGGSVITETGVVIQAHYNIDNCPFLHTLIIPGGAGSRSEKITKKLLNWIIDIESHTKRICSVCTGIFILAKTGLLNGRTATTHWKFADEVKQCYPNINIEPDALFIKDSKFITAAGITSGIDMALSLIEEDMGSDAASTVARMLVVFFRRSGGQNQFSSLLKQQEKSSDYFSNLLVWIADNLTENLSTTNLAAKVCLGERHFTRKFKKIYGETPCRNVDRIRIEVAKNWLLTSNNSVSAISELTGYTSADSFRRAFERSNGVGPSEYRSRFGHNTTCSS